MDRSQASLGLTDETSLAELMDCAMAMPSRLFGRGAAMVISLSEAVPRPRPPAVVGSAVRVAIEIPERCAQFVAGLSSYGD